MDSGTSHEVADVDDEAGVFERVEVDHVADRAVGDRRAEDRDLVARRPVADRRLVGDRLAELPDHRARRPHGALRLLL